MSGFQPIGTELLYACFLAGTVSVPTTSPGSSMTLGMPAVTVPGGYMKNTGSWSSSLLMRGGGLLIATATVPTFQFVLTRTTAQPAAWSGATVVGQTTTFTPPVTTGCWFDFEFNIGLRSVGAGPSGTNTVVCIGKFGVITNPLLSTASADFIMSVPLNAATYTVTDTTWPQDQQIYLWPTLILGAATAGNTVTMEWLKLYGEN